MKQQRSKNKPLLWAIAFIIFLGVAGLGYFVKTVLFPSYEPFTVIHQKELSSPKYGTYVYRGVADQTEYSAKTKRKPIGETQTGDRILELKEDPNHQYFVLIFNTEMPWWDLYEKK